MSTDRPLPPGSVIGILGGGQLGRMLAVAACKLGLKIHIYCPDRKCPASQVANNHIIANYDDEDALRNFANNIDIATYEFENVPATALEVIAAQKSIAPSIKALQVTQDRLHEKEFLQSLGIPVAEFSKIDKVQDLQNAVQQIGVPSILKTRCFGYDGKGQVKLNAHEEIEQAYKQLLGAPALLEKFISFSKEVSIIAVRGADNSIISYDICENIHQNQILSKTLIPAAIPDDIREQAFEIAKKFAEATDYIGVFAIEFFFCPSSDIPLIVNEIAPRVHNSGHWTIDACKDSQFENHIRAIAGWPINTTERHFDVEMINLIGHDIDEWEKYASEKNNAVHIYGKRETLPGRKMGHVTKLFQKKA